MLDIKSIHLLTSRGVCEPSDLVAKWSYRMMTSSNGNIFRVTGRLCGNSPVTGEFQSQRPVRRSFDVFFYMCPKKLLCKQSRRYWFETPSCSLWSHFNDFGNWLAARGSLFRADQVPVEFQSDRTTLNLYFEMSQNLPTKRLTAQWIEVLNSEWHICDSAM